MLTIFVQDHGVEIRPIMQGDFSAVTDGSMIGVIDFIPGNYCGVPETAFLELLMIAAPFRKQGIGHAVVEAVENEIRRDGKVKSILSGVQVNNPQAIDFWRRNGYQIVSEPELQSDQTTTVQIRKNLYR